MIRAVLFDFSGTLADCGPAWWDLEIYSTVRVPLTVLRQRGQVDVSDAVLARADDIYKDMHHHARETGSEISAHEAVRQALATLGLNPPPHLVDETLDEAFRACLPAVRPVDGALETLQALKALGLTLGVISNARHGAFVSWALARLNMAPLLSAIVVSADVHLRKPQPPIYLNTLAALHVQPGEAAFVGDHYPQDMAGARAAGLWSIWLTPADKPHDDLPADLIIHHLPELLPWVREHL